PMLGRPREKLPSMRLTSSAGAGAPPPPTVWRLEVSYFSKSGCSSMSHDMVGTPTNWVTRSRSMSSRARPGSHLYMMTSFEPDTNEPIITGTAPVTWKSGTVRIEHGG